MSIFSKFFFRTFFYHPEIPSSLYGATDGLWRPHGARFILIAPIWGGGVEIIGLAFYPPHPPKYFVLWKNTFQEYIYIYIYIYILGASRQQPERWVGLPVIILGSFYVVILGSFCGQFGVIEAQTLLKVA